MKSAAIAVLLVLLQTAPMPRQEAKNRANHAEKKKDSGASHQTPSMSAPIINPQDSKNANSDTQTKTSPSEQKDISVRVARLEYGKINIQKDIWDYLYIGASILVTIATLIIAISAVKQAGAAKATAEASKAQSEAIITGDRAWILVEPGKFSESPHPGTHAVGFFDMFPVVRNNGRTPGWITKGFIRLHVLERDAYLPPEPDYEGQMTGGKVEGGVNIVLSPNTSVHPMHVKIPLSDIAAVQGDAQKLYVYGFIDYLDFAKNARQTRFCFAYHVPRGFDGQPTGFYQAVDVPDAYNKAT